MERTLSKIRIFASDPGVFVHFGIALIGLTAAFSAPGWTSAGLFLCGWMSYVVQEHLVHRFIFHAPAPSSQFLFDLLYRVHYGHHDRPRNPDLLFTPVWFSLAIGFVNLSVVSLFLPLRETLVFVYGGGVCAYLVFEWIHLTTHFHARGQGRFARAVTLRHARHHYLDYARWFTVSPGGQLVDSLLFANPDSAPRVENVRTCGMNPEDERLVRARERFGVSDTLVRGTAFPMAAE